MEGENEKTCTSCGKPLKEGASFCTNCGAALAAPEAVVAAAGAPPPAATATPPPAPPVVPPPVPPAAGEGAPEAAMPGMVPAVPSKRSKVPLLVGIMGGILIIAGIVVLVLWLTVWKDSGGGTGDPIALAEKYINAMEKGDVDAYFACFEPEFFSMEDNPLLEEMGMDIKALIEMTFEIAEIKFDGYALELESERGDKATVVTTAGTLSISTMGFEEEYDLADEPMVFEMVKKDGRWYLTMDPMPGSMGGDMNLEDMNLDDFNLEDLNLDDFNLEDMEGLLPEDLNLEDLENLSEEDLNQMLEDLEKMLEDMPVEESSTST